MLRESGSLTVSGAAEKLGIGQSTVHRSLSMLVYRGFASRSESRTYLTGPALSGTGLEPGIGSELINVCRDHMLAITGETGETCHLLVMVGNKIHFLFTTEGTQPVRVGNRRGQVMPAEQNSGGLAMLAECSPAELRVLYPKLSEDEFTAFRRRLHRTRTRGFAINNGMFEHDVSAVGTCLRNDLGDTLGALTLATPTSRFRSVHVKCAESLLKHTRDLNRRLESVNMPMNSHQG
ncbi:IclR family transcriptional regulator [Corynebacterium sp. A21]|uniref:IclR family transcriptional regulator n=1 Tax=Corynebacterium sp. A21 TaxID=3457318 RepID=UPI003FD0FDE6